jgi:hypothetical protein
MWLGRGPHKKENVAPVRGKWKGDVAHVGGIQWGTRRTREDKSRAIRVGAVFVKAKGVGELGICGVAAAAANAIYNATGVRVRDYPVTLDKLLAGMPDVKV